jgi:hypothetical protein
VRSAVVKLIEERYRTCEFQIGLKRWREFSHLAHQDSSITLTRCDDGYRSGGMETSETAFFEFDTRPAPETITIKLTDPQKIAHARAVLSGKDKSAPHIWAPIIKKRVA